MRKKLMVVLVLLLAVAGYVFLMGDPGTVRAGSAPGYGEANAPVPAEKAPAVESKEVTAAKIPTFNGIAYIAGHGGHMAIIDMRTMKEPVDIEKDRIVITEAGSEMQGVIAGMQFEQAQKVGGSHGQALVKGKGKKTMIVGTLSGDVYTYDLATGKKNGPIQVGKKFCGAIVGPDGNIYLEDMADGHIYIFDPVKLKTVDKMPVGAALCGIQWSKNKKKAYISDMPLGIVYVYDWKTKKKIKEIKSSEMTFIHQARMSPDGKQLWVSAPNEFDPGLKPGTHKSQVIIIDTATDKVVKRIILPDNVRPHDFAFTADGKYVLLSSRTYGDDSTLNIMNTKNYNIEGKVSACAACHKASGIQVKVDKGSPLLCGIEVDWNPGK